MIRTFLIIVVLFTSPLFAASYELPTEGSRIVGRIQYHSVQEGETYYQLVEPESGR